MSIVANTGNWGKIYSYSWWGSTTNDVNFGDDYYVSYLLSDLERRVQIYENNTMSIQLLNNLKQCYE
jgi:hypothetical protein